MIIIITIDNIIISGTLLYEKISFYIHTYYKQ